MKKYRRIGITGSIYTGETEIINELSRLTGIPKLEVNKMDERCDISFFHKKNKKFNYNELFEVSLRSFLDERKIQSKVEGGFLHECSFLQQYIKGVICLEYPLHFCMLNFDLIKFLPLKKSIMDNYHILGKCIAEFMQERMDSIIHLPVEYPLPQTEINSFPNEIRKSFDKKVISFIQATGIEHYIITGSMQEKIQKIKQIYDF